MPKAKKTIPLENEYFKYTNPNPAGLHTTDCTVRALAIACDIPWDTAYDIMAEAGRITRTVMDSKEAVEKVMEKLEFSKITFQAKKGTKRPTMRKLTQWHTEKDILIGQCAHHINCMKDKKTQDIWDSSETPLYRYWTSDKKTVKTKLSALMKDWEIQKEPKLHKLM